MARRFRIDPRAVFLNVPYDQDYEKIFVAVIATLVILGRKPRLVFEIPDHGQGRLRRIFDLMRKCAVSVHDLSRVEEPRYNMPFELGIAFGIQSCLGGHKFVVLESRSRRLDKTLSDLKGIDTKIHSNRPDHAIAALLEIMQRKKRRVEVDDVMPVFRDLWKIAPLLKKSHRKALLYSTNILRDLIEATLTLADSHGLG